MRACNYARTTLARAIILFRIVLNKIGKSRAQKKTVPKKIRSINVGLKVLTLSISQALWTGQ